MIYLSDSDYSLREHLTGLVIVLLLMFLLTAGASVIGRVVEGIL